MLPFDPQGLVNLLDQTKSLIAEVLGWAVIAILTVMLGLALNGRIAKPRGENYPELAYRRSTPQ